MKNEQRKLTEKELQRKERFDALSLEMQGKGYTPHELTVGLVQANIMALIIMLPFAVLFIVLFYFLSGNISLADWQIFAMIPLLIILIVAHELIHGLVWGLCCKERFRSIEFGVIWAALTPYCTCSEPLKKWQYVLGGMMPTLILGFALGAVAVLAGSLFLLILAEGLIFGGGGDFIIILKLLRYRPTGKEVVYCDHPYECGLVAFEK